MKKLFIYFLIIGLVFSSTSNGFLQFSFSEESTDEFESFQQTKPLQTKSITIYLNDGLALSENNEPTQSAPSFSKIEYKIQLNENVQIHVDEKKFEELILINFQNPFEATHERIRGNDKPKTISKNPFVVKDVLTEKLSTPSPVEEVFIFDKQILEVFNFELLPEQHSTESEEIFMQYNIESTEYLVLLIPFVGYFFFRIENKNISIDRSKNILSSFFIILLLSSAFSTPFLISENYYPVAFAEEITTNSSSSAKITIEPKEESVEEEIDLEKVLAEITAEMEAKRLAELSNTTSTEPVIVSNTTSTEVLDVPDATVSFQFVEPILESNDTSTEIIKTNSTDQNFTTLVLDGQDDFIQIENVTVTDDVDGLTVTAWVKPDYSSGSKEFTVLSKDKSFALTITNNFLSENTAKFSVFDGIKWTTIESTSIITENWSFLSSTFDGDAIAMFVNGTREATKEVVGVPTLTTNGKLETTTVENLTSEEDIVIGATITTKNEEPKPSNQFSGEIDDVSLYDYVLNDEQILAMYEQTKDTYAVIVPELSLEEIIAQMEAEQELASISNQTTIENTTSTEIIEEEQILVDTETLSTELEQSIDEQESEIQVTPEILSLDDNYELGDDVTFDLEFYDEYDALMLEISEIESATELLLAETEQNLAELDEVQVTETQTSTVLGFLFGLQRFLPLQMADAAQADEIDELRIALTDAKQRLEQLKADATQLKTQTPDEQTVKDLKAELKDTVKEIKSIINKLQKANLSTQATGLQNITDSAENIGDVKSAEKQNGKWSDDESELVTDVYDAKGNKVNLSVAYEKIRDGKFNVKFSPTADTKPGLYKIVSTYTVNGVEHTVESEFAWGLVSLNTLKSIYKPGETAEFVIVVLDSEGHPIGNADLSMTVVSPDNQFTGLASGKGITEGEEIGLYEASYATTIEGTYNITIHAVADGIDAHFDTTFDVAAFYEYDILRTAQSKIDPTINPNFFDVVIDVESFTGKDTVTITETIPAVLEVETDATVITVGDRKVLTWTKDLVDSKTTVEYTYSVPFVFPSLYDLGHLRLVMVILYLLKQEHGMSQTTQ